MKSLEQRLADANKSLAPYAVPQSEGLGRVYPEPEDVTRSPFQRDRDRIVSSDAFRRLTGKMQVLPPGFSDHVRNRGTHTLDVAFNARNTARALGLNEDLVECLALQHDLGHPPFGHAGEEALNECLEPFGKKFEHNEQSLRIVTLLTTHSAEFPGLNLSREILEGGDKHRTMGTHDGRSLHLEAQITDASDAITYTAHDTEDALDARLITIKDLERVPLSARAIEQSKKRGTSIRGALLSILSHDLLTETEGRIFALDIQSLFDVYRAVEPIVGFSPTMKESMQELRQFLWDHFYMHVAVQEKTSGGKKIVTNLFESYKSTPPKKILELQKKTDGVLEDAVKDYIAGMTDDFAMSEHVKL